MTVHDTARGRYLSTSTGPAEVGWTTVRPATAASVVAAVDALRVRAPRETDGAFLRGV